MNKLVWLLILIGCGACSNPGTVSRNDYRDVMEKVLAYKSDLDKKYDHNPEDWFNRLSKAGDN
jgi:hypothetical protein